MKQTEPSELSLTAKIWIVIMILCGLAFIATLVAAVILLFSGTDTVYGANVAVIPIEGEILVGGNDFGVVSSDTVIEDLRIADEDERIEAVILRINSPGGSAVASDEIAAAVQNLSKPSVAVIREVGASGAYWIASSSDHVVANRMSITGSIGVIGSYLSFGKFLNRWNVTYNQLIAGDQKDLGTPFRELTPAEKRFLEEKLDLIHEEFIIAVAANRNMTVEQLRPLAQGQFFLGSEAKKNGLIDELGGERQALDWLKTQGIEEPVLVVYEHEPSIVDLLSGLSAEGPTPEAALQALSRDAATDVPMAR